MEWNEKAIVMDVRSLHHQTRKHRSACPVLLDSPPACVRRQPTAGTTKVSTYANLFHISIENDIIKVYYFRHSFFLGIFVWCGTTMRRRGEQQKKDKGAMAARKPSSSPRTASGDAQKRLIDALFSVENRKSSSSSVEVSLGESLSDEAEGKGKGNGSGGGSAKAACSAVRCTKHTCMMCDKVVSVSPNKASSRSPSAIIFFRTRAV